MKIIAIIPARMGSSRFPGKPLKLLNGKPMIQHVYENAISCKDLNFVTVATCDAEIFDFISSIGGNVVMTRADHERASDRCAEALNILEQQHGSFDIVVMIQGDEPMIKPEMIKEALKPMLDDNEINVVNLLAKIESVNEFEDRNCIKVVVDNNMNALYFSREPIPSRYINNQMGIGKQVCVIPFRKDYLLTYLAMKPTRLEMIESIDMLRILEHGGKVKMVNTLYQSYSVDTPDDLSKVEGYMKSSQ